MEPSYTHEVLFSPLCIVAVLEDLSAFSENNTWTIVRLPSNRIPIGCKWLFNNKLHASGDIARYMVESIA